jgi:phytanoyl-CoA hydroxylase
MEKLMSIERALTGGYSFFNEPELAIHSYQEHGFHIEKNFFTPEYCDFLINAGNNLSGARAQNFRPAMMPHKESEAFLEALKYHKANQILKQIIGGTPTGLQSQFFYCKPGTRGFSLHQDNYYVEATPAESFISIWVPLVDTTSENGGLIIYPGTNKAGRLEVRQLSLQDDPNQDKNANNEETVVPTEYQACNLSLSRGTALFIHAHLVHASHDNKSNANRYSVLNLYLKEGQPFRSGNSARREPVMLS